METAMENGVAVEAAPTVDNTKAAGTSKNKKKKPATGNKDVHGHTKGSSNDKKKEVRKGPSKKTIAAIQEAIQKVKAEEERQLKEEDAKAQRQEEAENARLEKLRLEQERKERKKLKEKEKKEKLKAEGKFLTQKQKEKLALAKQRTEEMLQAMRIQGAKLPTDATGAAGDGNYEKRPPRLGTRIRTKKSSESVDQPETNGFNSNSNSSSMEESGELESPRPQSTGSEPGFELKNGSSSGSELNGKEETKEEVVHSWEQEFKRLEQQKTATNQTKKRRNSSGRSLSGGNGEYMRARNSLSMSSSTDDFFEQGETRRERALHRIQFRRDENEKAKSLDHLRSPVVCVLGHVDTGKTKILDKLRRTHVQDGEAGGITQQIGATNVPIEAIKERASFVQGFADLDIKLPGLLVIDTPGHESFSNLRSRGSSLCDIAILVVDIMHGLEQQTIESINLLKSRKTPFIVALNKIDRIYEWNSLGGTSATKDIRDVLHSQSETTLAQFEKKTNELIAQFALHGLNVALLGRNPDPKTYVTMVPTSAMSGEGMWNLIALIVELSQTMLAKRLMYSEELLATVLEVKQIPGLGTTIDLILLNGKLAEGQTLVVAGTDGPIVTQIRSLLTPHPMKELRVKNQYIEYKEISGAIGVKLAAKDLEKAIAGFNVLVAHCPDEIEVCKEEIAKELKSALHSIRVQERGVYVQASTLGSLEALLEFLNTSKIPFAGVKIGPVVRKDVMKASTMLEHESKYAAILAFDVKIEREAQEMADSMGVRIFHADIIYHLFDQFTAYSDELKQKERNQNKHLAVFPCKLKILPECIFKTRDPIIVGVNVEAGSLHVGTPLCVMDSSTNEILDIGRVASIESNHKAVESARKGQEVCIKIDPSPGEAPKALGRHFQDSEPLISRISRESIDVCKEYFRDELDKTDWHLMIELKKTLHIL